MYVKLTALFSITVQILSHTLISALFLCLFVFCMLNLAYTGLVLFGKFLYLSFCKFCILVHVLKFCRTVIFVPILKLCWHLFCFAPLSILSASSVFTFSSINLSDCVPGLTASD